MPPEVYHGDGQVTWTTWVRCCRTGLLEAELRSINASAWERSTISYRLAYEACASRVRLFCERVGIAAVAAYRERVPF